MTHPWKRREVIGGQTLYLGDCLEVMPALGKVDACITDPPYGKVKGEFDHAWTSRVNMLPDAERWLDGIFATIKPNGTLWWFAWPSLAGRIEDRIARRMNVLAHVVWQKPSPTGQKARKESLRAPMPVTERIIMSEHYGADNAALGISGYQAKCDELRGFVFEPLRAYLCAERDRAEFSTQSIDAAWQQARGTKGCMAGHWFGGTQWALPTESNYLWLRELLNRSGGEFLRREYEDLRREYEDLRREYEDLRREYEDLRRYFDCKAGDQFSDIWNFSPPKENHGHPTQKPLALMEYLVRLSVRPSGVCLDPFMGSGTTLCACQRLGRSGIGIELDEGYFDIACRRVEEAARQPDLLIAPPAPVAKQEQLI